ncbi:hypothetical protein BaRGS_00024961 [Batillaria attramentaria]|uniref:Uncharacterized protein n=1 Tax=Batillaria attramentaria TaxID=370345 RepID=A0ABD0K9F9_9CAEN
MRPRKKPRVLERHRKLLVRRREMDFARPSHAYGHVCKGITAERETIAFIPARPTTKLSCVDLANLFGLFNAAANKPYWSAVPSLYSGVPLYSEDTTVCK